MICTKEFSVTVNPLPTIDWNNMVWNPYVDQFGGGIMSGSGIGDTLTFSFSAPDFQALVLYGSMMIPAVGNVNCQATFDLTAVSGNFGVGIMVFQDAFPIYVNNPAITTGGITILPFTVQATPGSLIEIVGRNSSRLITVNNGSVAGTALFESV